MSHHRAIDWIENPFQNLHPRMFNKQRKGSNKRRMDWTLNTKTAGSSVIRDPWNEERLSCPVTTEYGFAETTLKQGSLITSRVNEYSSCSSRGERLKQTAFREEHPLFSAPAIPRLPRVTVPDTGRIRHKGGIISPTQSDCIVNSMKSRKSAICESGLDSRGSLLSVYSSCSSLNQDMKTKAQRYRHHTVHVTPFFLESSSSDPRLNKQTDRGLDYSDNQRYHLTASSPTLFTNHSVTSEGGGSEVLVKPKLHRSCSLQRNWSRESSKHFNRKDNDF